MPRWSAWDCLCVTQRGRDACGQVGRWVLLDWQQWSFVLPATPCKLIVTGQCFASASRFLQSPYVIYYYSLDIFFSSCFGNVSVFLTGWSLWCTQLGWVPPSCWHGGSSAGIFRFNTFLGWWMGSSSVLTRFHPCSVVSWGASINALPLMSCT